MLHKVSHAQFWALAILHNYFKQGDSLENINGCSDWSSESCPLLQNPKFDWCWQTIAEAGCLGRKIFLCRGKLLGGSTCLNAQLALRGAPEDYDSWEAIQ